MAPIVTKRDSQEYAIEIADLLVEYEAASLRWRDQAHIWKQLRKRLAQYKLVKRREQEQKLRDTRRQLWNSKQQAKQTKQARGAR